MFDEIPTSGMKQGGIYYIKSIKKLYVADSDTSGVVKNMTEKSMYVKLLSIQHYSGMEQSLIEPGEN